MFTPFRSRHRVLGWAASLTALSMMHSAWAVLRNVQVDRVVRGTASFATSGSLTTITASNHAIINYKQFNIANGQTVQFVQPSRVSKVLNRITSNAPSLLDGSLLANGIVYFVNPAGVMFGPHSIVSVGGIIAAAGNITDNDFSNNVDHFSGTGSLVNNGTINAGNAQLVGQSVANHGVINAPGGLIAMVAGQDVMLGTSSSNILVKIGTTNSQGGVSNDGTINAAGGQASLVSGDIYSMALGTPSVLKANQVNVQGGSVAVSGKIDASNSGGNGGAVTVIGQTIALQSANIDASGTTGGGTVFIGGNFHGAGPLPNAQITNVSADSVIRADALAGGNGGQVAIWSEASTTFAGTILARGANGGSGGTAEISSRQILNFNPTKIDLGGGPLLLDPASINIVDDTGSADINGDGATGDDITGPNDLSSASGDFPGAASVISSTALNTVLSGSSVTLAATDSITDSATAVPVHVLNGITLTLDAPTINLYGPINVDSGGALAGGPTVLVANVHNTGGMSHGLIQNGIDVFSALGANYPIVNIDGGTYGEDVIVRQGSLTNPVSLIALGPVTVNSLTVNEFCPAYFNGTFTATNGFTINEAIHAGVPNASLGAGESATLIGPMTVNNDGGGTSEGSIDANDLTFTIITDNLTMSPLAQIDNNFSGEGTAVIQPETDTDSIGIGDAIPPAATLQIDPVDNIGANLALVVIGSPTGSGAVTVNTSTFKSPVTIQSPSAGGSITINGQLNGPFANLGALTLIAPAAAGSIAINAPIIMPYQRSTVLVEGGTMLAANITTAYSTVTFTGDVVLGGDASIDTTSGQSTAPDSNGANISFASISDGGGHNLTLNAGNLGTISFSGNVDNVANLTITNSAGAMFAGTLGAGTAGNVTISDSQNGAVIAFDGAVDILTLTTAGASPSYVVEFNQTTGGQTSTIQTASLANTSGINFGNDTGDSINFANGLNYQVGATEAIGTVTTDGTANIDLAATVFTGDTSFTLGTATFHGAVSGDVALIINGNAAFDSTLATLASLHVTGNTSMTPASLTTGGAQAYDGDLTLLGGEIESFTASAFSVGGTLTGDSNDVAIHTGTTFHAITGVDALQIYGDATFDGSASAGSVTVTGATTVAAGNIATTGDQNYEGILTLTADTTFSSSGSGAINFEDAVDSGSTPRRLTTDTAGTATFNADIGDTHPLANLFSATGGRVVFGDSGAGSTIAISTVTTSPNGLITLSNAVTLAANTTITARAIDFAVSLDSDGDLTPRNLTITAAPGTVDFAGPFSAASLTAAGAQVTFAATGQSHPLGAVIINASSVSASSVIDLNNSPMDVSTADFTSPVTLTSDLTLTATGNVTFESTVDSDSVDPGRSVTINTPGTTTFDGEVGSTFLLSSFTSSSAGTTVLNTDYFGTSGTQSFNNPATLGSDVTFQGSTVTFNDVASGAHALEVQGNAVFNAAPTVASITVTDATTIHVPSITTTGSQNYQGSTTLTAGAAESFGGTSVTFAGLTGDSNNVTVTGDGTFGGVSSIALLQVTGNAIFNGGVSTGAVTVTGTTTTSAGTITTSGAQDYQGAITLEVDSTFASTDAGNLTFAGTIDSSASTPVSLLTNTAGLALFEGNIGGAHPLSNFQTAPFGTAQLGSGSGNLTMTVNPAGEILFNNPLTLAADITMNAGTVVFSNTLDSDSDLTPRNLTITAAPGTLTFDGAFKAESLTAGAADVTFGDTGQTHELGNVIINQSTPSSAFFIDLNAGSYNYTSATFTSPVVLTADTSITASGAVDFQSTIDSDSSSTERSLTINTPGLTTFAGDIGDTAPLSSLTTGSAGSTDLNGSAIHTAHDQTYNNPVSLSANTTLDAAAIDFASTITGNSFNLTANASTTFAGAVMGIGTLAVNNNVFIDANITSTGSQAYSMVDLGANVTLTGNGISASFVSGNTHNLTLNAGAGAINITGNLDNLPLLTIANSSSTSFAGTFDSGVPGAITITNTSGAVAFEGITHITTLTTAAHSYSVSFTGATTTVDNAATFNNTGGLTLTGGTALFSAGLTNTAGPTTAAGSVATAGGSLTLAALTLSGDATLDSTNSGGSANGAALTIASIAGNGNNLTLTSGAGAISVTGNTDAVASLTITNSGGATFGGTFGAGTPGAVAISDTAANDTVAFDGNADITTFSAAATTNAYNVAFNAGVGGQTSVISTNNIANTGSLILGNDPADKITFTSGLTRTGRATSLSGMLIAVNNIINLSTTNINADSTIDGGSGAISISAAPIAAARTLNLGAGNAGPITLGTVAGASASNPSNVVFSTTGRVSVTGAAGPNIGDLTISNSGGATFAAAVTANTVTLVNTTGAIAFNAALTAGVLSDAAGSFDLQFLGTTAITNAVTLGTTGTVTFGSGGTALAFAGGVTHTAGPDVLSGTLTSINAPIDLDLQVIFNSTIDAGTAAITLGDTTLNSGVTFTLGTGNSGPITVASVSGTSTSALVIDTTGAVNIPGAIGSSSSPIESLTVTSGPATFGDAITTAGDISITANDSGSGSTFLPGDLVFHGNLTAGGNITLQPGTTLVSIAGITGAYSGSTITFYNNTITAGGNVSLIPNVDIIPGPSGGGVASPAIIIGVPSNANIIALGSPTTVNGFTGIALNIQAANFTMGHSANLLAVTGGVNISVSSGVSTFSTLEALGSINIFGDAGTTFDLVSRGNWIALGVGGKPVSETGIIFFAGGVGQPNILSTPDNFPTDNLTKYALSFATSSAGTATAITLNSNQLLTAADVLVTANGSQYYLAGPISNGKPTPPAIEFFGTIPMVDQQLIKENIIFDSAMRKQFWRLGLDGRDITLDTIDGDGFRAPNADEVQMVTSASPSASSTNP